MDKAIFHYTPGEKITLYDAKRDRTFSGTFYFDTQKGIILQLENEPDPETNEEFMGSSLPSNQSFNEKIPLFSIPIFVEFLKESIPYAFHFIVRLVVSVGYLIKKGGEQFGFFSINKIIVSYRGLKNNFQVTSKQKNNELERVPIFPSEIDFSLYNGELPKTSKLNALKNLLGVIKRKISLFFSGSFLRDNLLSGVVNNKPSVPPIAAPLYKGRSHIMSLIRNGNVLYGKLALVCLIIAFFSFISVLFPVFASGLNLGMPTFTQQSQISNPKQTTYNSYFQAEKDPIYPIREFKIIVPKINIESNIVDNVDPSIEDEYKEKLQYGVAHAKGSYLPGQDGPIYLFAHSTDTIFNISRYNAEFFNVKELEKGDEIQLYLNGKQYKYIVKGKQVIDPKDIDVIRQMNSAGLILQTCWPPGTDWQRLIIFADPYVEDESLST